MRMEMKKCGKRDDIQLETGGEEENKGELKGKRKME